MNSLPPIPRQHGTRRGRVAVLMLLLALLFQCQQQLNSQSRAVLDARFATARRCCIRLKYWPRTPKPHAASTGRVRSGSRR